MAAARTACSYSGSEVKNRAKAAPSYSRLHAATSTILPPATWIIGKRLDVVPELETHLSTRPKSLDLIDNAKWRGIEILETVAGGPEGGTGTVESRAIYLVPAGEVRVPQARSRFVREDGRWFCLAAIG
jgi:SEC-C motif-containing protein